MDYLIAIIPSLFAGIVLYFILRWINRVDRTEREVQKNLQDDAARWYEKVKSSQGVRDPFGERPTKDPKGTD